jgi:polyhydroxybutyrate depolymerase
MAMLPGRIALVAALAGPVVGCASNAPAGDSGPERGGAGARAGSAGMSGTGGVTGSGGTSHGGAGGSGGSAGVPESDAAGRADSGGMAGSGGSGAGGSSADGGGTGGESGSGATGGQGGTGGAPAQPSAGCGKQGRPSGGTVTVANDHIYTFPESYDGTKPIPLFIGFHACGNPIDQFLNLTRGSKFETEYVRAFPRSSDSGGCWNYGTDIARVTRVYDELMSNYCIDKNRVFGAGHSSGAQMIVQILTHKNDAAHIGFKAVSPVAASDYGALSGSISVLYIQGKNDTVRREDGATTVARFRTANACGTTSMAYSAVMACQSSGKTVNPGCVVYDGCELPTIWCSHDDPQYSGTSHGVPCFAIKAMYDFFGSLP